MSFIFLHYANTSPNSLTTPVGASTADTVFDVALTSAPWDGPFPYVICVDRGFATQEVCLVTSYSAGLIVQRNYDGNGIYSHVSGLESIEIISSAADWQNFSLHSTDSTRDDHTALMKADGTRHNFASNHQIGMNIASGVPTSSNVGDIQSDGNGNALVRADHIHGRIDTYATYSEHIYEPGFITPLSSESLPPNALLCNGGWYNQSEYPLLFAAIGPQYPPAPITNPGWASSPFNPVVHFAVPTMGTYVSGVLQWVYGTQWMIHTYELSVGTDSDDG